MKKTILAISFLFASISVILAQDININTVFRTMPDNIIFGLETEHKDKLLSTSKDTSAVAIRGTLYSNMKRTGISDNFISLKTSDAGSVQIKLLPLVNDSKIICVVKTACTKVCDSQIQFYTTKWVPIAQSDLFPAQNIEWYVKAYDSDDINQIIEDEIQPIKLSLSAENDNITAVYDIKGFLPAASYKVMEPYLINEPRLFVWDKTSYKYSK